MADPREERYRRVRLLGEGGAGRVWLVEDRARPGTVHALKELAGADAERGEELRREFVTLAALRHPNLVEVGEFLVGDGEHPPRFTLEYVDGLDVVRFVAREGPAAIVGLAAEALRALAFLHDFGLIHRDLKPANVLVRERPRHGCRLVLLDFGLSIDRGREQGGKPAGSLPYMPPEMFEGEPPGPRTDLHSLGAVFHEVVHGVPPFGVRADDSARLIEAIRAGSRIRRPWPSGAPPGLEDWLEQLLARDPGVRPASASEALARLNAACGTAEEAETAVTRAARLRSGEPPGRGTEIDALWTALDAEPTRLVWLAGDVGTGKSRMLRWLAGEATRRGWIVFQDPALDHALDWTQRLIVYREAADSTPTLALLDEVERAGPAVAGLLEQVASDVGPGRLKTVAAIRGGEIEHERIRRLYGASGLVSAVDRIELGAFRTDSARAVALRASAGGAVADQTVDWLLSTSEGNPSRLEAVLVAGSAPGKDATLGIQDSVKRRLLLVSEDARAWVSALSVCGASSPVSVVGEVSGLPPDRAAAAAAEATEAGLAREAGGEFRPDSQLVADTVLRELPTPRRRALYSQAAAAFLSGGAADPRRLARLYSGAGDRSKCIEFALDASNRLASTDPGAAADWRAFAVRHLDRRDSQWIVMRAAQADLLMRARRYREAARALAIVVRKAPNLARRVELLAQRSFAFSFAGQVTAALRTAREAIALSEVEPAAQAMKATAEHALGAALFRRNEDAAAKSVLERAKSAFDRDGKSADSAEAAFLVALIDSRQGRLDETRSSLEAILGHARQARDINLEAKVLSALAGLIRRQGRIAESLDFLETTRRHSETHGLSYRLPGLLQSIASTLLELGRVDRALDVAKEGARLALHEGLTEWVIEHRGIEADAWAQLGRPAQAVEVLESLIAARAPNAEGARWYWIELTLVEALLALPHPPVERIRQMIDSALERPGPTLKARLAALLFDVESCVRFDDAVGFEAAWPRFCEARDSAGGAVDWVIVARATLARARFLLSRDAAAAEAEAADTARRAERDDLPAIAAQAWAVASDAAERAGHPSRAAQHSESGHRALHDAAERIEDPELREDFLARPEFRELARLDLTAADTEQRLTAIYDMIRSLNSESDPEAVLESMLDMMLSVVRAERGLIILRGTGDPEMTVRLARNLEHETIRDAAEFSKTVVLQAGEGRPVLSVDVEHDERLKNLQSVSLYGIRSVLAVPLRSRREIVGAVYVDSRSDGALFSQDDLRFLEAFADHASLALENARVRASLERENRRLQLAAQSRTRFGDLVGASQPMQRVYDLIERFAATSLPVLVLGESGTGKELVARALHRFSARANQPFLSENCSALAESLLESELFGHVKGAFTGADREREGLFKHAHGGTLLLDEIGDMPFAMQSRLLRVLQEGQVRKVGGDRPTSVDVRVIAATNKNLHALVGEGRFREDLLYRLQVLVIELPPLRERPGDVPLLVDHILERIGREKGVAPPRMDLDVRDLLERHVWPGNVRELESAVRRLAVLADDGRITRATVESDRDLGRTLLGRSGPARIVVPLAENEKQRIRDALELAKGNRNRAAKLLGISRATIFRKIKEYGL